MPEIPEVACEADEDCNYPIGRCEESTCVCDASWASEAHGSPRGCNYERLSSRSVLYSSPVRHDLTACSYSGSLFLRAGSVLINSTWARPGGASSSSSPRSRASLSSVGQFFSCGKTPRIQSRSAVVYGLLLYDQADALTGTSQNRKQRRVSSVICWV